MQSSENDYVKNPVSLKALRGVDFMKYALPSIIDVVQLSEYCSSKNIFSATNIFMHIFNMSATYHQSVEKIQWKLSEESIT